MRARLGAALAMYVLILLAWYRVGPGTAQTPGEGRTLHLDDSVTLELVRIPAGTVRIGAREVSIGRSFYMGRYEVTNRQFRVFWDGYDSNDPRGGGNIPYQRTIRSRGLDLDGDDQPVVHVSWAEAMDFCDWLARRTGEVVRLPSEAEWEYACRGPGVRAPRAGPGRSATANVLDRHAWESFGLEAPEGSIDDDGGRFTVSVGRYPANGFGLHDMLGNAAEWTRDVWHEQTSGIPADGSPWTDGGLRNRYVFKGGSWETPACGCEGRNWNWRDNRNFGAGFRVVVETRPAGPGGERPGER